MVALHPKSKVLTTLGLEYFVLVVHLCKEIVTVCNQSAIKKLQTFFSNRTISTYSNDLLKSSRSIQEQLELEEARENSKTRELINIFSSAEVQRKKVKTRLRLLRECSDFDYQKAWRQARKCGASTWMERTEEYKEWRDSARSSTVLLSGKLGAGKTVLLANIIDDLNRHSTGQYIAYFFCRADDRKSQSARTVMGCVARQVLEACHISATDRLWKTIGAEPPLGKHRIKQLFEAKTIRDRALCLLLDGIDECGEEDREEILDFLVFLQENMKAKLCVSHRLTGDSRMRKDLVRLCPERIWEMADENPDIEDYIQAQLEMKLESGHLVLRDPTIILEIQQALQNGAEGM